MELRHPGLLLLRAGAHEGAARGHGWAEPRFATDTIAAGVEEATRVFVEGEADDDPAVPAVRVGLPGGLAS